MDMIESPQVSTRPEEPTSRIATLVADLAASIPDSRELQAVHPDERAKALIQSAALRSAAISGALALPPGPLGIVTIIPDLKMIWGIQQQLVADIASCFGKRSALTQEVMVYCLFRHGAALLVRDLAVRVGERMLIRRVALRSMQKILQSIGIRATQKAIASSVSRYVPILGAMGVGGYSYYDTSKVGATALELFSKEIEIAPEEGVP